jgi:NADH dehydrogenase FAD-containing subunit
MENRAPKNIAGRPNIIIVGGSFAGMTLTRKLYNDANITLVDKKDHFEYWPTNIKILVRANTFDAISVPYSEIVAAH